MSMLLRLCYIVIAERLIALRETLQTARRRAILKHGPDVNAYAAQAGSKH